MVSQGLVRSASAKDSSPGLPQSGEAVDRRYASAGLDLASTLYLGFSWLPAWCWISDFLDAPG